MLADLSTDARELVDSVRLDVLTNTYRTVLQLYSDRLPTLDERNPGGGELFPFMTRSISKYEEKSGRIVDCLKAMHAVWPSRNNVSSFGGTAGAESEEDEFEEMLVSSQLDSRSNIGYNKGMTTLKLTAIGNSTGVIFPKELLEKLRVSKGDILTVTETPRGVEISAYDQKKAHQMELAEKVMRENRNLLKKLAQ